MIHILESYIYTPYEFQLNWSDTLFPCKLTFKVEICDLYTLSPLQGQTKASFTMIRIVLGTKKFLVLNCNLERRKITGQTVCLN